MFPDASEYQYKMAPEALKSYLFSFYNRIAAIHQDFIPLNVVDLKGSESLYVSFVCAIVITVYYVYVSSALRQSVLSGTLKCLPHQMLLSQNCQSKIIMKM